MKGLDEKQNLQAFPLSLMGGALRWYYSLDPSKTKVWNELVKSFVDQLIFNIMIDVTLRNWRPLSKELGRPSSNT